MGSNCSSIWGCSPLPLLPQSVRQRFAELPAPAALTACTGRPWSLEDLDASFWEANDSISRNAAAEIAKQFASLLNRAGGLPVYENPAAPTMELGSLKLSARTSAAFKRALSSSRIGVQGLDFETLLELPGIGAKRVLELSCALEAALISPSESVRVPAEIGQFYRELRQWVSAELGHATLADVLPPAGAAWPASAAKLWERVRHAVLPPPTDVRRSVSDSVPALLDRAIADCSELTLVILRARILACCEPTRLEVLTAALGETTERILSLERCGMQWLRRFDSQEYAPVMRRAERIRDAVGAAVPADAPELDEILGLVVADIEGSERRVLARELMLWLAGPYQKHRGWLLTGSNLVGRTVEVLLRDRDLVEYGAAEKLRRALSEIGILPVYQELWAEWVKEAARVEAQFGSDSRIVLETGSAVFRAR